MTSKRPLDRSVWAVRFFASIALIGSAYLAYVSWQAKGPAGCGANEIVDCQHVLKSRWSSWFNLPVAIPATLTYLALLVVSFLNSKFMDDMRQGLGIAVGIAAFWFTGIQFLILKKLCTYCLVVHACGIAISVLTVVSMANSIRTEMRLPIAPFITSIALVLILIAGQFVYTPDDMQIEQITEVDEQATAGLTSDLSSAASGTPTTATDSDLDSTSESRNSESTRSPASTSRQVSLLKGSVTLDTEQHPMVGKPAAETVLVKLFDYTCKNCRQMHKQLKLYSNERDVAVVVLPVPMNQSCNEFMQKTSPEHLQACDYARLALAVWKTDRSKFEEFHDWLMEGTRAPSLTAARIMAEEICGSSQPIDGMTASDLEKRLQSYTRIYNAANRGVIPKLFVRDRVLIGVEKRPDKFREAIDAVLK